MHVYLYAHVSKHSFIRVDLPACIKASIAVPRPNICLKVPIAWKTNQPCKLI